MRKICLFILLLFPIAIHAQSYRFDDQIVELHIEVTKTTADSIDVSVKLKNKSASSIHLPSDNGNYAHLGMQALYLYIGWDQINATNCEIEIFEITGNATYAANYKIGNGRDHKASKIMVGMNYALASDLKKKMLGAQSNKKRIFLNDYMLAMKWYEWSGVISL